MRLPHPLSAAAVLVLVVATACAGCATPAERFDARVRAAGLAPSVVRGEPFDHLVLRKPGPSGALHVYIEGDGTPWLTPTVLADDPTPSHPLALDLMLRDGAEAVYLGRPCYFGIALRRCDARTWSDARYSEAVVRSMASALRAVVAGHGEARVRLIGHSGGGVLATLLARYVPGVETVLTVGANLDVAAWTRLHRYTPLHGSLDPAALAGSGATEIHLVGSDDRNVPPALVRAYARGRANVEVVEWPRFDHVCCWAAVWHDVLAKLER